MQKAARGAYKLFLKDPYHPSLHFEKKHGVRNIWSVYISAGYRALGVRPYVNEIRWFFIGTHADYMKLLP